MRYVGLYTENQDIATKEKVDAKQDKIIAIGILKRDENGTVSSAIAGDDYMSPVPVSTADNGKFLRVVDGGWAAVTIENANGASF